MSVVALPLLSDGTPHYTFACVLDGQTYTFEMIWNDRDDAWYMQIGDASGSLLAAGLRVVGGKFFLQRLHANPALPPGDFYVKDTTNHDIDPGLADLGSSVQICYLDAASMANVRAGLPP